MFTPSPFSGAVTLSISNHTVYQKCLMEVKVLLILILL